MLCLGVYFMLWSVWGQKGLLKHWQTPLKTIMDGIPAARPTFMDEPVPSSMAEIGALTQTIGLDTIRITELYAEGVDDLDLDKINRANAMVSKSSTAIDRLIVLLEELCE